jgi:hypothetical protein
MKKISWLLQTAVLLLAACNPLGFDSTPNFNPDGSPSGTFSITLADGRILTACNSVTWPLNAGGSPTRNTGFVNVSNDNTNLYITVNSTYGFQNKAENIKVMVAGSLDLIPTNLSLFKWKTTVAAGIKETTLTIPFADIEAYAGTVCCTSQLYIFVHADVFIDGSGTTDFAWGGTTCGRIVNCGCRCYGVYTGKCCSVPPPPTGSTETAFAKGGYVFTTETKSNPEGLPTLGLTRNRWGWAINLTSTGETTYPIYAGAGLNYISKGSLVGLLTVNWDGTNATITYLTYPGFLLSTVHIYAGDTKPTTIAPGLYGNTVDFDPKVNTYSATISVSDTDSDGIWIIAHAGVLGDF